MRDHPKDSLDPFNTRRPKVYKLGFLQKLAFYPAAFFLLLYFRTWRISLDRESREILARIPSPRLIVSWHNRSLVMPEVLRRFFHPDQVSCLISPSRMAAWEVAFFRLFNLRIVRGSTTRRSIQAARDMLRESKAGYDVGITPDGPSGPLYSFKPGSVAIARRAGIPLLIVIPNARSARRLKTWDRHLVPWPFARIEVAIRVIPVNDPVWESDLAKVAGHVRQVCLEITRDPFHIDPHE